MMKNHVKLMTAGMLVLTLMTGCGLSNDNISGNNAGENSSNVNSINENSTIENNSNENSANEESGNILSTEMKDVGDHSGEQDIQTDARSGQTKESGQSQSQDVKDTESIEEELAAYRAERERGVSSSGGYTMVQAPNEENYHYGIGEISSHISRFDSRELNKAYEAADAYIKGTLNLESEVWGCVDPRMNAIYEDEDKGVANGYDADDIFLCEYNDNGNWQYLILVREGKGSDWEVLYHGSSYKTD